MTTTPITKKGHIFPDYWVRCGICGEDESLAANNKEAARQETVRLGYKRKKGRGLVCKECLARLVIPVKECEG